MIRQPSIGGVTYVARWCRRIGYLTLVDGWSEAESVRIPIGGSWPESIRGCRRLAIEPRVEFRPPVSEMAAHPDRWRPVSPSAPHVQRAQRKAKVLCDLCGGQKIMCIKCAHQVILRVNLPYWKRCAKLHNMRLLDHPTTGGMDHYGRPWVKATFALEQHGNGTWLITCELRATSDGPAVTSLRIEPGEGTTGSIDSNLLRQISTAKIRDVLVERLNMFGSTDSSVTASLEQRLGIAAPQWWTDAPHTTVGESMASSLGRRKPGRKGLPDLFYAQVARRYVELVGTEAPVVRLAQEIDRTPAATYSIINRCRSKGFLTPGTNSRFGSGELTDKASEVLDHEPHPED